MEMRAIEINSLAVRQLAAWQKIAKDYLLVPLIRRENGGFGEKNKDELHLACPACGVSVYAIQKQSVSPAIILAATVAHLRNMHRELDPDA
jgi:hypothetical protein